MIHVTGTYIIDTGDRELVVPNRLILSTLHRLLWSINADIHRDAYIWYFADADIPDTGDITASDTEAWGRVVELDAPVYDVNADGNPITLAHRFHSNTTSEEHTINGLAFVVYDGVGYNVVSVASFPAETIAASKTVYTLHYLELNVGG